MESSDIHTTAMLTTPDLNIEVRSLRAPPDVVRDVLEGVLRLMGIADTSWHSMKNFLSKRGVKEDIRCLDASQISPAALQGVQKLLEKRGGSFEASTARRASAACAPLAAWVRANIDYAQALARVQPLQARQANLHHNLQEAENQLGALSSGLATVDERVAALKDQLGQHTRDAATLELRLQTATTTIQAARGLLDQLAHEYTAWENDLENISKEIAELNLRSLLAAAYIVYLPDITEPQAREYIIKWSSLIGFEDSSFSVINFLSTSEKQLKWDAEGLPSDKSAIKNAVLVDEILQANKCGFTPLVIDPDGDGIAWLKNTLADMQCEFVSQHSEKLLTTVQYAVRLGKVLVITEVDGIEESWSSLVCGLPASGSSVSGSGNASARLLVHCRDDTLPARLPPHYLARLSPLHFTARLDGLTDQLVHYALQQQNPEVNEKAKEIKMKKATLQKQQHELQENLLRDLSSNVDILHDANLLASLNKTRATSNTILEALEAARAIERESTAACEAYESSANRAAILALAVKQLATHRPLVALPVDAILDIYVDAIRRAGDQGNINNEEIIKYLTRRIIERVLLGLHKKDKYIIVMHLLKQVYEDLIPEKLWPLFISSYDVIEDNNAVNEVKKNYSWVPGDCAKKIAKLKTVSEDLFNKLALNNEDIWKEFLSSGNLNTISRLKLSAFETVVAVAALRPDSLYRAIVAFVDQILGAGVVSAGEAVPRAARCARAGGGGGRAGRGGRGGRGGRPILLLGAHAADVLAAHAHSLTQVGIEEGRSAWEAAVTSSRGGGWLALQVGASPFTQELQAFLAAFVETPAEEFNDEFRLWIVSEDRDIPPLISNICVNVILEAPEGVKNNVMGTLSAWGAVEATAGVVRLHACLALFHALVQERRAYIPHGWSRWYSWEWGEVCACADAIRSVSGINSTDGGSALVEALYAARVSSTPDRRVLAALHDNMMSEAARATNWRPRGLQLTLPYGKNLQAYASAFDGLPSIDTPQLLGLPDNCRVAWEKNAAMNIVAGLIELNSTVSINQKSDNAAPLKTVLALWKKLMSGSPLLKGEYQAEKVGVDVGGGCGGCGGWGGWWWCVCGSEAGAARRAAAALHRALAALARARAPHHAHAHTQRHMHKVPDEWQLLWAGPDSPAAYIKEFCHRARSAVSRLKDCQPRVDYMPNEVDLRSFLRPSRVVWALRVRTAARLACAVHSLALHVNWDSTSTPQDNSGGDGLIVVGLRLSGCEVADGALHALGPTDAHAHHPRLLLRYLPQRTESLVPESSSSIVVPVYTSEAREELVFEARAPLARNYSRDTALLNAIALYIAPVD